MSAGLSTSSAPLSQHDRAAEKTSHWHKNGTIERIMRDRGAAGGERLHALEKSIAVLLLGYASTNDRNPRCFRNERDLVEDLGLDRKTFAKYIRKLVDRGLIETRRDRCDGAMTYYLHRLISAFSETGRGVAPEPTTVTQIPASRNGKLSRSDDSSVESPDREDFPTVRESAPLGSGNAPDAVRESFPLPIELVPGTSGQISHELQSLARRIGVNPSIFENRPHRVAAAKVTAAHTAAWGITHRRLRTVCREKGFTAVAGAVGYVLTQIELGERRAIEHLKANKPHPENERIRNPAAVFETAVSRGWADALPGLGDDPYMPNHKTRSIKDDLWIALLDEIKTRLPRPTFEMVFASATLEDFSASSFTISVSTEFAATVARTKAADTVRRCLDRMGFPDASIALVPRP